MRRKKGLVIVLLLALYPNLKAQTVDDSTRINLLFSKNHVSFTALPALAMEASVSGEKKYNVESSAQTGIELGFNYHYNFNRHYSAIIGLHTAVFARNLKYIIPKSEFQPPTEADVTSNKGAARELDLSYFKMPLEIEKRWISKKRIWNAAIGLSLLYSIQRGGETNHIVVYPGGQKVNFMYEEIESNNGGKPWLNYHIAGGHSWLLNNNNILKANIVGNFSSTEFAKGTYKFTIPVKPITEGSYTVKGSFVGLSCSYILSGVNNKMRQNYLKNE